MVIQQEGRAAAGPGMPEQDRGVQAGDRRHRKGVRLLLFWGRKSGPEGSHRSGAGLE